MIDLLAVSSASFTAVNRAVYRELAGRGWDIEIIIPARRRFSDATHVPDPEKPGDPPLHALETTRGNPRLSTLAGLRRVLDGRRPRIVLLDNDPNSRIAVELGLWTQRNGAALVCQSCENLPRGWRAAMQRAGLIGLAGAALTKLLGLAARPRVDHVLVISEDGRRVLTEQGYPHVTRIPLGFDPTLFRVDEGKRLEVRQRLGLNQVTVAYFGRISEAKGVHLLVEALAGLGARPFQFLLDEFSIYRSPYEQRLGALLRDSGLEPRVVRFDATHEEMPAYMNAADVVVIPSVSTPRWKEQYGRVAPEAMACGRAVIVSNSGTLPDLVGEAGICVREGSVPALRDAIEALLVDGARRSELGRAAAKRAHAELDLTRQADLMEGVLRGILGR